jgi:aspartate aminotransferase
MPSSPIRRLVDFAVAAQERGTHVLYLNIGQPDVHSPEAFWNAVADPHMKVLEYSHSAGIAELRTAAAEDYRKKGFPVDPADVMVTTGGSEAVLLTFLSCFDPGDEVVVVEPFYANYAGFATAAGISLKALTTRIEDDFALPAPEVFEAALGPRTRGILLCNPSNPTGTVYSPESLRKIAAMAKERDLFLIVDEVYRDFYYGTEQLLSVLNIEGLEHNAIMIDSVSKKFSLCGARVGFLVTKNREVLGGALKYGQARLAAPTLDQHGVAACLREVGPDYFAAVKQEYLSRRDALIEGLQAIHGVVVPKIEGAFYAVVRLPVDDTDRFCEWLVKEFFYEGETVLLAPASGFYLTPGEGKDEVRIAYVLDEAKLRRATRILAAALEAYPARLEAVA